MTLPTFTCRIEEVHSGDDFIAVVDLGIDGLMKRTRIRLAGVDAPNAYKAGPNTEAGRLREEVKKLLVGKCVLCLINEGRGGWVGEVSVEKPNGEKININQLLQGRGYIYPAVKLKSESPA